jgi:hypothetical protein
VAVLDAGNIATEQSSALFNVALREILFAHVRHANGRR